jgi:hypothetical protein
MSFLLELLDAGRRVGVVPEAHQDVLISGIELHEGDQPALPVGHQELTDVRFGGVCGDFIEFGPEANLPMNRPHPSCSPGL